MTTNRSIKNAVICIGILVLLLWLSVLANPLQKPGDPGIPPILLAEISELNAQIEGLEATIQYIEEQNADLEAQFEDLMTVIQDLENFSAVPKTGKTSHWVSYGPSIDFAPTGRDGI